jgi:hypothetical protein
MSRSVNFIKLTAIGGLLRASDTPGLGCSLSMPIFISRLILSSLPIVAFLVLESPRPTKNID